MTPTWMNFPKLMIMKDSVPGFVELVDLVDLHIPGPETGLNIAWISTDDR